MDKFTAIKLFLYKEIPDIEAFFNKRTKNGSKITLDQFINVLSKDKYDLVRDLNSTSTTCTKLSKSLFPNKTTKEKLCTHLFAKYRHKICCKCKYVLPFEEFYKATKAFTGFSEECKICTDIRLSKCTRDADNLRLYKSVYKANNRSKFNEWEARRRARKLQAIPKWADLEKIKEIYNNCPEGQEVDHYYPLLGELVCGLHVETNLQYLTSSENRRKGNSMPL